MHHRQTDSGRWASLRRGGRMTRVWIVAASWLLTLGGPLARARPRTRGEGGTVRRCRPSSIASCGSRSGRCSIGFAPSATPARSRRRDVDLQRFTSMAEARRGVATWRKVADVLDKGEMPPPEARQPKPEDRRVLRGWVGRYLDFEAKQSAATRAAWCCGGSATSSTRGRSATSPASRSTPAAGASDSGRDWGLDPSLFGKPADGRPLTPRAWASRRPRSSRSACPPTWSPAASSSSAASSTPRRCEGSVQLRADRPPRRAILPACGPACRSWSATGSRAGGGSRRRSTSSAACSPPRSATARSCRSTRSSR